ncbi:MAG TPA: BLUF domain-containing protein [bacterium]|nr:BLUF domain-containing protein [bacterium]
MSELYQLAYVSQATFNDDQQSSVRPEVSRILLQSRKNNPDLDVVGALYYKNGYFFQVLEGSRENVEGLYAKILKDPRHKNSKILVSKAINRSGFNDWSMKYGVSDDEVNNLLNENSMVFFNPYKFNEEMTNSMIRLLQNVPLLEEFTGTSNDLNGNNQNSSLNILAIVISSVALVVSVIAIFMTL